MKTHYMIVVLYDHNDNGSETPYLVKTALTPTELDTKIIEIKQQLYDRGLEDWSYDDLIKTAEQKGYVTILPAEQLFIDI